MIISMQLQKKKNKSSGVQTKEASLHPRCVQEASLDSQDSQE